MSNEAPRESHWAQRDSPGATYRLQLGPECSFDAATKLVGYLAALGITHLYLSPVMRARSDRTSGYEVVDPQEVSPVLGGEEGLRALANAAGEQGLALVVDFVPNHLAASPENRLWEQLLATGPQGPAGRVFDVDWRPPVPGAEGKVILPVLAEPYGSALAKGALQPVRVEGTYRLSYGDRTFPLAPGSAGLIDDTGGLKALTGATGSIESWQPLHQLLEQQHYRLVHWRIGDQLVNYRRFFAVDDLVAVRVEDPEVFELLHQRLLALVDDRTVAGLRIDHPDGLRDPERYLERLRNRSGGVWTIVEKILHPGERLPPWSCAGTTGYDFCNDVLGLFIDPAALPVLTEVDRELGGGEEYAEVASRSKRDILNTALVADLERLTLRLWDVSQQHPEVRDVTRRWCRDALVEALQQFDVYRTYVDPETGAARQDDRARIAAAVGAARASGDAPPALYEFLERLLSGDAGGTQAHLECIARFQQLCAAVTAKGIEDTAFYRYRPLLAANEVGGDPAGPARSAEDFHNANAQRSETAAAGMLTTATHDSKRGEDVRLRMAALSELAERWREAVQACEADAPDDLPPQSRLLVYQTVVGVWPLQGEPDDGLRSRLADYVVKAERESGLFTRWVDPDAGLEARLRVFAERILHPDTVPGPLRALAEQAAEIAMVSGLAQVVLRTFSPGVPDLYQGNELWEDRLVDPDNRRAVDFGRRAELLDQLADSDPAGLIEDRRDGRIKLYTLRAALHARLRHPACVEPGSGYLPLTVTGRWTRHVVAFARVAPDASDALLLVTPRLPGRVMNGRGRPPVGEDWDDTTLEVPEFLQGSYEDVLTGAAGALGDTLSVAALLSTLPVAVLERV